MSMNRYASAGPILAGLVSTVDLQKPWEPDLSTGGEWFEVDDEHYPVGNWHSFVGTTFVEFMSPSEWSAEMYRILLPMESKAGTPKAVIPSIYFEPLKVR